MPPQEDDAIFLPVACIRQWNMHISRKLDAAAARGDPLARLYRGYYCIATDSFVFWQLTGGVPDVGGYPYGERSAGTRAMGTAGTAGSDRQYAGLKQHCVLYTDAARALYRTWAELLAQTCREPKGAVRAEKKGGKMAAPNDIPAGGDLRTLWPRQDLGEVGYGERLVNTIVLRRAADRAQVAAMRYFPTEALIKWKPPEDALHRWLGLSPPPGHTFNIAAITEAQEADGGTTCP